MSTTTMAGPDRVTVTWIDRGAFDFDQLRSGEGLGMAATGFTAKQFDRLPIGAGLSEHRVVVAWETDVVDAAIEEVMPQIRDLIADAIERRLPWTWEVER